jgi:hypothetical protein
MDTAGQWASHLHHARLRAVEPRGVVVAAELRVVHEVHGSNAVRGADDAIRLVVGERGTHLRTYTLTGRGWDEGGMRVG